MLLNYEYDVNSFSGIAQCLQTQWWELRKDREQWRRERKRLSQFDNAMQSVIDSPPTVLTSSSSGKGSSGVQDNIIREGFLKFFVAIFKDYKK